jgi:hypothetical protein
MSLKNTVKRSEHKCAVSSCTTMCPRENPFCLRCWMSVPAALRDAVWAELDKRQTPDLDRSALYFAVQAAAAAVTETQITPGAKTWERLWRKAGSPELEVIGR